MTAPENDPARQAYENWLQAVTSGTPEPVVALYDAGAVLLPTLACGPRQGHQAITEYFQEFTAKPDLQAETNQFVSHHLGEVAVASGLYTFSYDQDGQRVEVPARFSFTFRNQDDDWLIVSHHSSTVPPVC